MSASGKQHNTTRGNIVVFWLGLFLLLSALGSVLLLAHDGKNLQKVAKLLNIDLSSPEAVAEGAAPKTSRLAASRRPQPRARMSEEAIGPLSSFVSATPTGKDLCNVLRSHGLPVSKWAPDILRSGAYECSWERAFDASRVRPDGSEGLFLIVKGRENDAASSLRIKFRLGQPTMSRDMMTTLEKIINAFDGLDHWHGVVGPASKVLALKKYEKSGYGVTVKFSEEISRPGNYNLVLYTNPKGAAQKQTEAYFTRTNFLAPFQSPAWNCRSLDCGRQLAIHEVGRAPKSGRTTTQVKDDFLPDPKLKTGSIKAPVSKTHFDKN